MRVGEWEGGPWWTIASQAQGLGGPVKDEEDSLMACRNGIYAVFKGEITLGGMSK